MKRVLFSKKLDERNTYLKDYLLKKINYYLDSTACDLLEIGCGNGRFATLLGSKIKSYTGIEPDEKYLKIAKETTPQDVKTEYYKGIAEKVPLTQKFDIILYAFSWHFIDDFDKALEEAKRLLKREGIIIIYEPSKEAKNWADPRLRKDSPEFDKTLYRRKLADLQKGREGISQIANHNLIIVEEEINKGERPNLWIIKHAN